MILGVFFFSSISSCISSIILSYAVPSNKSFITSFFSFSDSWFHYGLFYVPKRGLITKKQKRLPDFSESLSCSISSIFATLNSSKYIRYLLNKKLNTVSYFSLYFPVTVFICPMPYYFSLRFQFSQNTLRLSSSNSYRCRQHIC